MSAALPPAVAAFLAGQPPRTFEAGDVLLPERRASDGLRLGFVESGLVKGCLHPRHGQDGPVVLLVAGDGQWIGLECLGDPLNLEYRALSEGTVRLFDRARVDALPPVVLGSLLSATARLLNRTVHLAYTSRLDLEQRVLSRLWDLREACSLPEVRVTQSDLASLVGVHRNRIGPVLRRLQARGLLHCGYGEIVLSGLSELERAFREG